MAFNITQFRNALPRDGARPNLFEVRMQFPSFAQVRGSSTDLEQRTSFLCKTAQIPGSTIGVVPVQYFGREVKFAGNRTFADWTVTIINDEDFIIRDAMERWMNGINSHRGNFRNAAALAPNTEAVRSGYTVQANVIQYGKVASVDNAPALRRYSFIGLFPTDISPIDLDWGSNDSIEEFTVTFSYQWWEAVGAEGNLAIA